MKRERFGSCLLDLEQVGSPPESTATEKATGPAAELRRRPAFHKEGEGKGREETGQNKLRIRDCRAEGWSRELRRQEGPAVRCSRKTQCGQEQRLFFELGN